MAMNREMKRMLQRQGAMGADGAPTRQARPAPTRSPKEERTSPGEFLREVRGELRKVAWPTKPEIIRYSLIVLVTVVVLTGLISLLDWIFSTFVLDLYER